MKIKGEEDKETLVAANNYANSLFDLKRLEEARALFRKMTPVARRVLGKNNELTLKMRWTYAQAIFMDDGTTLDDLRKAVTTLEDTERTARRVLGGAHPTVAGIEIALRAARARLLLRGGYKT